MGDTVCFNDKLYSHAEQKWTAAPSDSVPGSQLDTWWTVFKFSDYNETSGRSDEKPDKDRESSHCYSLQVAYTSEYHYGDYNW